MCDDLCDMIQATYLLDVPAQPMQTLFPLLQGPMQYVRFYPIPLFLHSQP